MGEVKILEQNDTGEQTTPPSSKWLTCLIEAMILALGIVLIVLLRVGVYEPAYIPSASMENTLQIGDRVLVDHRSSLKGHWQRGDVVIFDTEGAWGEDQTLIKRVIGLPGEKVEVMGGQPYINGVAIAENYLKEKPVEEDSPSVNLGQDEYYVMGDNRNKSDDSRMNGPVKSEQITGRAVMVFYPLGRFGRLPKPAYAP